MKPCTIKNHFMPPARGDAGYLGAVVVYPPQPGEMWERSTDLADGPANSETLARITRDIEAVMAGYRKAYDMDNPA